MSMSDLDFFEYNVDDGGGGGGGGDGGMAMGSEDLLSTSLTQSGLMAGWGGVAAHGAGGEGGVARGGPFADVVTPQLDEKLFNEPDNILDSILNGSVNVDLESGSAFSDTSSDSGCKSPGSATMMITNSQQDNMLDVNAQQIEGLLDILPNEMEDDPPLQGLDPRTNSPAPTFMPMPTQTPVLTTQTPMLTTPAPTPAPTLMPMPRLNTTTTTTTPTPAAIIIQQPQQQHSNTSHIQTPTLTTRVSPSPMATPASVTASAASAFQTATTTIVLPVLTTRQNHPIQTITTTLAPPSTKRRRMSASSSDSGLEDASSVLSPSGAGDSSSSTSSAEGSPRAGHDHHLPVQIPSSQGQQQKYPPLTLNDEERRLCEREGIRLPSHYPLSREEEKNLKRIRRKIRNKVSAQDSRKRKKEYVDSMEDRVKACTDENDELHKKIDLLEKQNKTLAGQVRRLHQIIVNGGLKQNQTSTAMMVLLLSTALFLIPGFKEQTGRGGGGTGSGGGGTGAEEGKCELESLVNQAIKMGPMSGQSRSLLHNVPGGIKQEFEQSLDEPSVQVANSNNSHNGNGGVNSKYAAVNSASSSPMADHDYFVHGQDVKVKVVGEEVKPKLAALNASMAAAAATAAAKKKKMSYIDEDVPAQGYGPGKVKVAVAGGVNGVNGGGLRVKGEERRFNVTRGAHQGMRTVVLHVPKDIK